ncbi:alkaline phosphatase family protein [Hyalangium sp.]|uniref:alkaline phosphatase family protein n=1 Tax=Hyalangium sp. TaxID=2028555 RepID=UPI002D44BB03|nr:alkaline phosphatase family protein [Hyalangium sp.]HYI00143.1 alkaline phosphatase family protein [Hyalangium sp.]
MPKPRLRLRSVLLAGLVLLGVAYMLRPAPPRGRPADPPYLTYFLVDGLSQEVFQRELAAGNLPNMARLISEGLYVEDGIAAFPTMTGYGFYPFITGQDAVRSGVLGLRWFKREAKEGNFRAYVGRTNVMMNEDFVSEPPTLFECFPGQHTFSVNSYANRGVVRNEKLGWGFSMAKYQEKSAVVRFLAGTPWLGPRLLPNWYGAETQVLELALEDLASQPKVQWITFASPDGRNHIVGTDDTYVKLVRHIDSLIGRYREESRRLGQEEQRVYAVISDHGVTDVHKNVDLRQALGTAGLRAWRGEATHLRQSRLDDPISTWADVDVILAVNGNAMNYVYLRNPGSSGEEAWRTQPEPGTAFQLPRHQGGEPVDVVKVLREAEGVELVVMRADAAGQVRLFSRTGEGRITSSEGGLAYACEGEDPLGYAQGEASRVLCDGRARGDREWLKATHTLGFPDAVVRLHRLMTAPDVADLVVTAALGYDLAADYELVVGNYRGGHGGLRADQLRVPYILGGPGVPKGQRLATARAEDVGATVLRLAGCPPASPRGGEDLLPAVASPAPP